MSQPNRNNKSLREVTAIWRAIQNGDSNLAEQCCVDHVKAAAAAALGVIERSSAPKTRESVGPGDEDLYSQDEGSQHEQLTSANSRAACPVRIRPAKSG
jgi:hypothetical protein